MQETSTSSHPEADVVDVVEDVVVEVLQGTIGNVEMIGNEIATEVVIETTMAEDAGAVEVEVEDLATASTTEEVVHLGLTRVPQEIMDLQ